MDGVENNVQETTETTDIRDQTRSRNEGWLSCMITIAQSICNRGPH
jgi:hypothetical protein